MSRVKLGEQYVRFTVDGLKESEQAVQATSNKVASTWAGLRAKLISGLSSLKGVSAGAFSPLFDGLRRAGSFTQSLGRGVYDFFSPFVKGAMQGTYEADMLDRSLQLLNRSVGEIFAPAVRVATAAVLGLTGWVRSLSPETKQWVAIISLGTVALAGLSMGVTLLGVAFGGLATVAGIAWAVVTSPIVLVVAGIAVLVGAIGTLVDYFVDGSKNMSEAGDRSSKSWVGGMLNGIKIVSEQAAIFFNWYADKSAAMSDRLALGLSSMLERLNEFNKSNPSLVNLVSPFGKLLADVTDVQKGTTEALRKMDSIKPLQIDVAALSQGMDAFNNKIDKAVPKWTDVKNIIGEIPDGLSNIMSKLGVNNEMKFHVKMETGFEGLQQSWERLQSADFSTQDQILDTEKRQLGVMEGAAADMKEFFGNFKGMIRGLGGAAVGQ